MQFQGEMGLNNLIAKTQYKYDSVMQKNHGKKNGKNCFNTNNEQIITIIEPGYHLEDNTF